MNIEKIPEKTLIIGIFAFLLSIIIPYDGLESILGGLRPLGFVVIYLNPLLGLIGSIVSIIKKRWFFLILNILLIFSFFIMMSLF